MDGVWSLVQLVLVAVLVIFVVGIVKRSIRPPNYPPGTYEHRTCIQLQYADMEAQEIRMLGNSAPRNFIYSNAR